MSALPDHVPERGTVAINGPMNAERARILTPGALEFLAAPAPPLRRALPGPAGPPP